MRIWCIKIGNVVALHTNIPPGKWWIIVIFHLKLHKNNKPSPPIRLKGESCFHPLDKAYRNPLTIIVSVSKILSSVKDPYKIRQNCRKDYLGAPDVI
jgi:hypothetical protein